MEYLKYYLLYVLLVAGSSTFALDCFNTLTSEGWVNLLEGQFACAALQDDQKLEDLGKNYVMCAQGNAVVMPCPPNLRWDTSITACNYQQNCKLPDMDKAYTFPSEDTTSEAKTTITPIERSPTTMDTPIDRTPSDSARTTRHTEDAQGDKCVGAATSEGPRTLQSGQRACAPLMTDEVDSDLGRRFITCSFGAVHTQLCQLGLRYDTATDTCNWPQLATCALNGGNPDGNTNPSRPTTTSTTTTQSAGQTTTLPRTTPRQLTTPTRKPQPQPSGPCNVNNCKLPNCFCFGDSPSTIPLADMPMFVMLTFDDALTTSLYDTYFRALMVDNDYLLLNPSGCRTKSTLYVSHENTDYTKVKAVWNAGNEIGSHTIHHQLPQGDKDSDYLQMVAEIQGLKDEMLRATGNNTLKDSIIGFRAPYLRVAGDVQFDVLRDYGFLYDTSVLNINILQGKEPHWPFTFDFLIGECINPPCPTKAYPGMWEVPLNGWIGDNGDGCSMVDTCVVGRSAWSATVQEWYNFYNRNFHDYFYPIKVPMPIFTHGFLFTNYPNSYPALARWLKDLLTRKDVWLVTPTQVIEWMKKPLSNSDMIAQKWGC